MENNVKCNHIVEYDTGKESWLHLKYKYDEGSSHSPIELKQSLLEIKLNINENPDLFISELNKTSSIL